MARNTKIWTADFGRDKGKTFLITEMDAERAEEWGARAMFALMAADVDIPEEIARQGLPALAAVGIKALKRVPFDAAKPLFDEMMTCVAVIPDANRPAVTRANLLEDDIEEVKTRLQLRYEILMLHLDFFIGGAS